MLINLRNALMSGKRLPYDAEVEYLESTGTQWIDTGVGLSRIMSANYSISFTQAPSGSYNVSCLFGAFFDNSEIPKCQQYVANKQFRDPDTTWWKIIGVSQYERIVIDRRYDIEISTKSVQNSDIPLYLFARNNDAGAYLPVPYMRVYFCNITSGGDLVRDFIPVRKGTVGYLYDRVSGKLFGNAGTGDFTVGPDVVPVSFVDGEGYISSGAITTAQGLSRIDDYLPVVGGHSITFNYGGAANANCSLIVYNSSKTRIDYWGASFTGERTITMNANGAFARFAVYEESKQTAFLRDNTTGEYIMINGKRIVE